MKMFKNKAIKYVVSGVLSLALLFLLFKVVNLKTLGFVLNHTNYVLICVCFVLYGVIYLIRSIRFKILLSDKINISNLFVINCLHNFYNTALPGRLGELSFPYFASKYASVSKTESFTQLIVARFIDLSITVLFFLISLVFYVDNIYWKVFLIIASAIVLVLTFLNFLLPKIILKFFNKIKHPQLKFLDKITLALNDIRDFTKGEKIKIICWSLALNFLMFLFGYIMMRSLGYPLTMVEVFIAGTASSVTTLLPINSFFNIGTQEAGWAAAFTSIGLSLQDAATSGVAYHIINLIFTCVLFLIGYIIYTARSLNKEY